MGCGCGKKQSVKYDVTVPGSPAKRVGSVAEAQATLKAAGNPDGGSYRPVKVG